MGGGPYDLSGMMTGQNISGQINIPQAQPQQAPGQDQVQQLMQLLNQKAGQIQQQAQPIMGQYIPKQYQQGPGAPWANPNTREGQMANLGKSVGQAIGGAVTQYANRKEMQKAQNIAMDMQRLSDAITNPTPENKAMAEEILSDDKRRNEIAKTMNIQFMGDDKRKPYQKVANQLFHKRQNQQQQQQQAQQRLMQQQQQQRGQTPYFNQLQKQMPTMPGLSPQDMIDAQAIQLGLQPGAKEKLAAVMGAFKDQAYMDRTITEANWRDFQTRALVFTKLADIQSRGAIAADRDALLQARNDLLAAKNANDVKIASMKVGAAYAGMASRERIASGAQQTARDVAGIRTQSAERIQAQKTASKAMDQQLKAYGEQLTAKSKELAGAQAEAAKIQTASPKAWGKTYDIDLAKAKARVTALQGEQNELANSIQQLNNAIKYGKEGPTTGPLYGPDHRTQPPTGQRSVTPSGAIQPPTAPAYPAPPSLTGDENEDEDIWNNNP